MNKLYHTRLGLVFFLLRQSHGIERSKVTPYCNIGSLSIVQPHELSRAKKSPILPACGIKASTKINRFTLLFQRVFLALCFIFIAGCSETACRQWEFQNNFSQITRFNSGRLILGPDSSASHLEIEIARNRSGIRMYANVLSRQARPCADDPCRTEIEVQFEDQEPWIIYPYIFQGGQRLLLPGDVSESLIQALLDGIPFTVKVGRNQLEVISENFAEVYEEMLDIPIDENPTLEAVCI